MRNVRYFSERMFLMSSSRIQWILIVISLLIGIGGWLRPASLPSATNAFYLDASGRVVSYDLPTWVTGKATRVHYEGHGIYAIQFNNGWVVRVNYLGVVWRADLTKPPHHSYLGALSVIPSTFMIFFGVRMIRTHREELERQAEADKVHHDMWSGILRERAKVREESSATSYEARMNPNGVYEVDTGG